MTTPRVTELPRHLEPICSDTFLGGREDDAQAPPVLAAVRESRPLGVVLPMRPRDPQAVRPQPRRRRRTGRPQYPGGMPGPGGDAA